MKIIFIFVSVVIFSLLVQSCASPVSDPSIKILNFQADNGFSHVSMKDGKALLERLSVANHWGLVSTEDATSLSSLDLSQFDVIVFNNNCGNGGAIMGSEEHQALQAYIRAGGGFVGVHCASAISKEDEAFQTWFDGLIGVKAQGHPLAQEATLLIEDHQHAATTSLSHTWTIKDEWYRFNKSPRANVHVLVSVDESSYTGDKKMGGDHPYVWYQNYDGGRSFFIGLGHTQEIYRDPNFETLVKGGILWAAGSDDESTYMTTEDNQDVTLQPTKKGLFLDLNADQGVVLEDNGLVGAWYNQIKTNKARVFVNRDEGREQVGSGRPTFKDNVAAINGHATLVFNEQELLNMDEDAFDHMLTGSGYTWFSIMSVYEQNIGKVDVNSFFGNLKNGPPYEGFWGNFMDDNRVWLGTRNGAPLVRDPVTKRAALWDEKTNPLLVSSKPLVVNRYYLVAGRMGEGIGRVPLELYLNHTQPIVSSSVPVLSTANPSRMAIGQERDAINHPGAESFNGEIARFLIYDRALNDDELNSTMSKLIQYYGIKH